MDTVTLGHFQAPVVTAEDVATVKTAGKTAISSTKAFGKSSYEDLEIRVHYIYTLQN